MRKPFLAANCYVLAGQVPLCRPPCVYQVLRVAAAEIAVKVVYCPGSPQLEGREITWPRYHFQAAWRLGDVRVVRRWSPPADTIYDAVKRHLARPAARGRRPRREAA